MGDFLNRIQLAFQRLFADILDGNFGEILFTDVGLVAVAMGVPLIMIGTLIGGSDH